jgi:hypothetical protein
LHKPPLHVQGVNNEARWGQSALELQASVQAPTMSDEVSQAAGTIQGFVLPASQYSEALTQTFVGGLPTLMHPKPLGQSEPDAQATVQ